jgi:hypothetical protein
MMLHQRAFFSSSSPTTVLGTERVSDAGESTDDRDSVEGLRMNSPDATSKEVLVRLSSGTVGEDENHPPGKNRDEVVDSSLFREVAEEGISKFRSGRSELSSSNGEVRRNSDGLNGRVSADTSQLKDEN